MLQSTFSSGMATMSDIGAGTSIPSDSFDRSALTNTYYPIRTCYRVGRVERGSLSQSRPSDSALFTPTCGFPVIDGCRDGLLGLQILDPDQL